MPCHALMIWARCTALHKQLKLYHYQDSSDEQTIIFDNFPFSVVKSFIRYLYDDTIKCKSNNLPLLKDMAKMYQLDRLGISYSL